MRTNSATLELMLACEVAIRLGFVDRWSRGHEPGRGETEMHQGAVHRGRRSPENVRLFSCTCFNGISWLFLAVFCWIPCNVSARKTIRFSVHSGDDIRKQAEVQVWKNSIYDTNIKPVPDGLLDLRMVFLLPFLSVSLIFAYSNFVRLSCSLLCSFYTNTLMQFLKR